MTARAIALALALTLATSSAHAAPRPFRLHCTLDGKPMADWRADGGRYRIKQDGKWSSVPVDAVGPMLVLLFAGGAQCVQVAR